MILKYPFSEENLKEELLESSISSINRCEIKEFKKNLD